MTVAEPRTYPIEFDCCVAADMAYHFRGAVNAAGLDWDDVEEEFIIPAARNLFVPLAAMHNAHSSSFDGLAAAYGCRGETPELHDFLGSWLADSFYMSTLGLNLPWGMRREMAYKFAEIVESMCVDAYCKGRVDFWID